MEIAIIGAGVSGLTAAHKLHRNHKITVFESDARIGGHSNTVLAPAGGADMQPVDTGFIVFNDRNYPNFTRLLEEIGAPSKASNMSFSVADEHGGFEYAGSSLNALFANRRHIVDPRFHRMIFDLLRFNGHAKRLAATTARDPDHDISLREFLERRNFSSYFVERLIVPQVSAVWSADPDQLWEFPARIVFQFFDNHGILELRGRPKWRTIDGGSREYVSRLTAAFADRIETSTGVESVRRGDDGVTLKLKGGAEARFDEVVIATHSDQALRLLADATPDERAVLGAIPYVDNEVLLHTDTSLLPRRRAAWASWNYHLLDRPRDRTTVTYWMNNLQSISGPVDYCVTLNLSDRVDPAKVISEHHYEHPVFTAQGLRAQERHADISGAGRTHFCGAYWRWGFHEDGVWSGLRVAEAIERRAKGRTSSDAGRAVGKLEAGA